MSDVRCGDTKTMTAGDLAGALRRKYVGKGWLLLEELRTRTGGARDLRVLDALAFNLWPSGGFRRIAFEFKVSRSDFVAEIQNPMKRQPALDISHQFYFVTPIGLLKIDELPEGCGLMEVNAKGRLRTMKVAADRSQPPHLPVAFVATLLANLDPAFRNPQPTSLWIGREVTADEVEAEVEARCKVTRANQESRHQRLREELDEHRQKLSVLRDVMNRVFGTSEWNTEADLLALLGRRRPQLPYYCIKQIDRLDEVQRMLLCEWRGLVARFTEEPPPALSGAVPPPNMNPSHSSTAVPAAEREQPASYSPVLDTPDSACAAAGCTEVAGDTRQPCDPPAATAKPGIAAEVAATVALANDPDCAGRVETPADCNEEAPDGDE